VYIILTIFIKIGKLRRKESTLKQLATQFEYAQKVGGMASVKKIRTKTGIKDSFQSFFLDKLFAATTKKGRTAIQKSADVTALLQTFPEDITSPIWRFEGLFQLCY
jgi:hypothetical protein